MYVCTYTFSLQMELLYTHKQKKCKKMQNKCYMHIKRSADSLSQENGFLWWQILTMYVYIQLTTDIIINTSMKLVYTLLYTHIYIYIWSLASEFDTKLEKTFIYTYIYIYIYRDSRTNFILDLRALITAIYTCIHIYI